MKDFRIFSVNLFVTVVCFMATGAGAQGTFFFRNWAIHQSGVLDAPVFDSDGSRLFGTNYVAQLYGGSAPDSLSPARYDANNQIMNPTPFTFVNPFGETGYFSEPAWVYINGAPSAAWLQVRAWDVRLGASYEDVVALGIGGYGQSSVFLGFGGNSDIGLAPGFLNGLQSFSLLPIIPEPSSYALLAFGGAMVWLFRRQQPRKP